MFEVRLFGHMRASISGQSVMPTLPVATQRLWAFLLLHRGQPLARKHVAFTLWPDTDEDHALTNLRRQLHMLQRQLPKPEQDAPPWVMADRVTVQWSSAAEYWLDVAAFETACGLTLGGCGGTPVAAGEGLEAATDLVRLQRGVGLYTADLLVDVYDDWVLAERERLGRILDDALWRLVGLCAAEADPRGAVAAAARLLARDPLREEVHRLVIGLRYLGGDRAAALRAFQECRRVLARDLDVEPMPKTVRLVEAIRCAEGPDVVASLLGAELPGASVLARAAAGRVPHNLPAPISSFVGREEELAEALRLIAANRLVTLTGPGGCGKSRLAMELAGQLVAPAPGREVGDGPGRGAMPAYPDGVWCVDLAPVEDPHLVPKSVADVLKVREEAGADATETLARAIGTKAMLLVLDNCEHLVGACAGLAEALLRAAPRLRVVATSREVIGVVGEAVWPVPPMGLPPEADGREVGEAADYDAPRLFLERARLAVPGFAAAEDTPQLVAAICRRLEGMPLAIELAAARVRIMPLREMMDRLDDRFAFLGSGVRTDMPHHETLAAAIDWSYDLLDEDQQRLLRRLSVFRGGCTAEAVEAVCGGADAAGAGVLGLLANLVTKSLITADATTDRARYRMLETVRQYAAEKAASLGEDEDLRDQHLAYYVALAEEIGPHLIGAAAEEGLDRLQAEQDNLRAALRWARRHSRRAEAGLRIAGAIWRFWLIRGHLVDARRWIEPLLEAAPDASPKSRVGALNALGVMLLYGGETMPARARFTEAVEICRHMGDDHRVGLLLGNLGLCDARAGDYEGARRHYQASIDILRPLGDEPGVASGLGNMGLSLQQVGDFEGARRCYEEARGILVRLGDKWGVATTLNNLSQLAATEDRFHEAVEVGEESYAILRDLGDERTAALLLNNLAGLASKGHNLPRAAALLKDSIAINRRLGDKQQLAVALVRLASVARQCGRFGRASELLAEGAVLHDAVADPLRTCECLGEAENLYASWGQVPTEGTAAPDLASRTEQLARSAKLAACCRAVMAQRSIAPPNQTPEVLASREATREILGEEAHDMAIAEGAALTIADAFALATDPSALARMARLDDLLRGA